MIKYLPNTLSCLRILLSVLLLCLPEMPTPFIIVYFLCGASDVAHGYLARRLSAESKLGAKLDNLGDLIFFGVAIFILLSRIDGGKRMHLLLCIIILIVSIRATNFIITKIKFKQYNVIHTLGNKITGLALFLLLPVCILTDSFSWVWAIIVSVLAVLCALEESLILLTSEIYDGNRKSFFGNQGS